LNFAAGNPEAGKVKAEPCFSCHGKDGAKEMSSMPKLSGQHMHYLIEQIKAFKSLKRTDKLMTASVALLKSDQDMEDVAAYFSSLPKMKGKPQAEEKIAYGKDIYHNKYQCKGCHGEKGKGNANNSPMVPWIAGQNKDYLINRLMSFQDSADSGGMVDIAKEMSLVEVFAVAAYIYGM
jgi:cytochrome c553